jgi:predicted amidohydrolase YtcJ
MKAERIVELPLLHDHHSHVSLYASFEGLPDIQGLGAEAAMSLLRGLPGDRLTIAKGWRTDRLELGPRELAELPPLVLVNASLHGYALSPRALPFLSEAWPEFAERGESAAWGERNLPRLFEFYGRTAGLDSGKLSSFMSRMEALGLGSLEDMTLAGEEAFAIEAASPYAERIISWASPAVFRDLPEATKGRCAGIKIFLDGSLGARSAALDAPFLDGSEGALLYGDAELGDLLAELASYGTALSAHAIGREAIAQILRCLESLPRAAPEFPAIRLEHAQFISLKQARICKELGIKLSMQPNFSADSVEYTDRLCPRHRSENDPFRMLIDEARFVPGEDLLFGSDGMPHGPEEALRWSLFPAFEGQRLSIDELIAGYGPSLGYPAGAPRPGAAFAIDEAARSIRRAS